MIPVAQRPEPAGFDANVRRPGRNVLLRVPPPSAKGLDPLWKWAKRELYEAYNRICSYSCMYIPIPTGSIDHFEPKSVRRDLAYEWSNLRLALHRVNSNKANAVGIVDPFLIQPGWFVLDFPSCLVKAGQNTSAQLAATVEHTIDALKLNSDDALVQERCDIMIEFSGGDIGLPFLTRRYPFLAFEITRQGIEDTADQVFKTLP